MAQTYNLAYGAFGDLTSISVGNKLLASYVHNARTGDVESMTYGNGDTVEYVYNDLDQVSSVKYNGTERFCYHYTGEGQIYQIEDLSLGLIYTYTYDSLGRPHFTKSPRWFSIPGFYMELWFLSFVSFRKANRFSDFPEKDYLNCRLYKSRSPE